MAPVVAFSVPTIGSTAEKSTVTGTFGNASPVNDGKTKSFAGTLTALVFGSQVLVPFAVPIVAVAGGSRMSKVTPTFSAASSNVALNACGAAWADATPKAITAVAASAPAAAR